MTNTDRATIKGLSARLNVIANSDLAGRYLQRAIDAISNELDAVADRAAARVDMSDMGDPGFTVPR